MRKAELLKVSSAITGKLLEDCKEANIRIGFTDGGDDGDAESGPRFYQGYATILLLVDVQTLYFIDYLQDSHAFYLNEKAPQGCETPPLKDWILNKLSIFTQDAKIETGFTDDDQSLEVNIWWPSEY